MLFRSVEGSGGKTGILGVTVLTSTGSDDIKNAGYDKKYHDNLQSLVIKKAKTAKAAGCAGVICSGLEVSDIKKECGQNFLAVTPGIRPAWTITDTDDQKRITTPGQAIKNGSDYIVVGRPVRDAVNPVEAAQKISEEISLALKK